MGAFIGHARRRGIVDVPNSRSSHSQVTPRGGGVVVVAIWILFSLSLAPFFPRMGADLWVLLPGSLLVAAVGWLDDIRGMPSSVRLAVHIIAATFAVWALPNFAQVSIGSLQIDTGMWAASIAVLSLVWSLNLFNFMDGIDGIAAIEAIFTFGAGALTLYYHDASELAFLSLILSAALLGFLKWNWPKAAIFMGDVGSGFLGFLIAAFALVGKVRYGAPLTPWFILYSVFWYDALLTLVRRFLNGEKWHQAHRMHAYQRLHHLGGWTHRKILLGVIIVNSALTCLAIVTLLSPQLSIHCALLGILIVTAIYGWIEKIAPMSFAKLPMS